MLVKNEGLKNNMRLVYMCFMVVYMAVREVTPLQFLIDNVLVSAAVFAVGFVLILWDLITTRNCLKSRGIDFLVLFLIICLASSLLNFKYGVGGNIKAIGALILQYFVFFSCGTNLSAERKQKELRVLSRTLIAVWGIFSAISIHMYVFDIEYVVAGGSWGETTQGFSAEYQRLWGIFQDPNYASFISLIAVFASIYLMVNRKKAITYILCGLSLLVEFSYIVLAGSRAAKLLFIGAVVLVAVYWFCLHKKSTKQILVGVCLSAVCFAVTVFGYTAFQHALPLYKTAVNTVFEKASAGAIGFYNSVYEAGDVPVLEKPELPGDMEDNDEDSASHEKPTDKPTQPDDEDSNVINRVDTDKEDVSNGRFKRWVHTYQIFKKSPIWGTSPRNVSAFAQEHAPDTLMAQYGIAPHNGYLDVLVGTGALGMITLLSFLLMSVVIIIKKLLKEKRADYLALCAAAVFTFAGAAMLVSDVYMVFTLGSVFFFTMLGYAVNGEENGKESLILKLFNLIFCRKQKRGN